VVIRSANEREEKKELGGLDLPALLGSKFRVDMG
jgi:hypothetical protein